jgi:hypothetical protein
MIDGKMIIAFTPSGRQRYMDILWKYVEREHALGHVDKWVVFNNTYNESDDQYTRELANRGDWITVLSDSMPIRDRKAPTIHRFYRQLKDTSAVYVRLDDDLVFVNHGAIPLLVRHKIAHPELFLVFPTIVNNTRMSYWLQESGVIPREWGNLTDVFLEPTAWRSVQFDAKLQRKALDAIYTTGDLRTAFTMPDRVTTGKSSDGMPNNHISINSFVIDGTDMAACDVPWDEEGYLSDKRPAQLGRFNGIKGDAVVVHFAYHPQTAEMERTGMLEEYRRIAYFERKTLV